MEHRQAATSLRMLDVANTGPLHHAPQILEHPFRRLQFRRHLLSPGRRSSRFRHLAEREALVATPPFTAWVATEGDYIIETAPILRRFRG